MGKKKMSAIDFKKFKQEGKIFTMVTAYDYTTASIVDDVRGRNDFGRRFPWNDHAGL